MPAPSTRGASPAPESSCGRTPAAPPASATAPAPRREPASPSFATFRLLRVVVRHARAGVRLRRLIELAERDDAEHDTALREVLVGDALDVFGRDRERLFVVGPERARV